MHPGAELCLLFGALILGPRPPLSCWQKGTCGSFVEHLFYVLRCACQWGGGGGARGAQHLRWRGTCSVTAVTLSPMDTTPGPTKKSQSVRPVLLQR